MPTPPPLRQRALGAARRLASPRVKAAARRTVGRPLVAYERRGLRPQLSVVMPVYNVAEYLPAALDSVLGQTLHDLELIAVDDSSTDGCLAILRDYERRDPRVKVFTQPNAGQGPARNLAVGHARGEFLTFVDSDDTVPPEAFEYMVRRLRESGSDFSVGSVRRLRNNEFIRTVWARTVHARDRIGVTLEEFPNAMQDIIACNRMFRTAFWREQVGDFRGHIAYEDHVPMLTAYVRAKQFDVLNHVTYNWRIRENKTSTGQQKARLENLLDRIAVKEEAHELLRAEASDFVYDTWVGRTLEVDFPPFIQHAISGPDSYRNLLAATYRTYLDRASDRGLDLVTVRQKVRGHLVAQERWDEVAEADTWFDDVGLVPPAHAEDGEVVADPQPDLGFWRGLPETCARLSPLECHFEGVLERVAWEDSTCRITGWAVRRALAVRETPTLRAWLESDDRRVDVPVEPVQLPEANLWGEQRFAPYDLGGFVATVDLNGLEAGSWHLHVSTTYDGVTSQGTLSNRMRLSPVAHSSGTNTPLGSVVGRWDPANGLTLDVSVRPERPWTPRRSPLEVTGVQLGEDTVTVSVLGASEVSLGNPRVQLPLVATDGDWHTFSLLHETITGARTVVPTARYQLTAGGRTATAEATFAGSLPAFHHGALVNLDLGVTPDGDVTFGVEAPLPPLTRGASGKRRLRDRYKSMDVDPENSAALTCYRGEFCTDSQLALDRGLADRYPDVTRYWGVRDWSTEVPEGSVPLLLDSEEWYRALAASRYVSHNIDFGAYFRLRPRQRYLQTFHGYPFKSMGKGFWRSKGLADEKIARAVFKANREWDTILVPSEECAGYYREQYDFSGEILVAGYPRCDVLVAGNRWADADEVRTRVLGRLGVPTDKTVVLYAPTYRDKLTTRMFAAERFDELDLDRLARSLGEDFVVLLRGHNNNQRELDRLTGVARVLDVTDWPDVNELTLAADVAVLDYSSLRFDWALTGKPMVFFVPDLEEYFDQREPLFPYEGTAPGPWTRTTDEVAAALADLPGLRTRYGGEVAAFNARFNALNDGKATDRVLDWWTS